MLLACERFGLESGIFYSVAKIIKKLILLNWCTEQMEAVTETTNIKNMSTCFACNFVGLFDIESGSHLSRHRQPVGQCDDR